MQTISRQIIPYQVITGNYNWQVVLIFSHIIIPYQVITGNYNSTWAFVSTVSIIPYQVITGNYNMKRDDKTKLELYHTK